GPRAERDVFRLLRGPREAIMFKPKWKLLVAGTFVACVFGGFAIGIAWATQGQGITTTFVVGPTPALLDEFHVVNQSPDHGVIMKTRGLSDVYVVKNTLVPGGHTGWHSHPGSSIISVVSGTATEYRNDDPKGAVYTAGTAFVDEGEDHAHII